MSFIADLHLHSRFAYACSKHLTLANMAEWAKLKGIDLLSSADFTHPAWLAELEGNLTLTGDGDYQEHCKHQGFLANSAQDRQRFGLDEHLISNRIRPQPNDKHMTVQ